jgi:hypothetical protein
VEPVPAVEDMFPLVLFPDVLLLLWLPMPEASVVVVPLVVVELLLFMLPLALLLFVELFKLVSRAV